MGRSCGRKDRGDAGADEGDVEHTRQEDLRQPRHDLFRIRNRCGDVGGHQPEKYRDQPKFVWARRVISDLGESEEGRLIQSRLLTELCRLRNIPDSDVPDRTAALDALRKLKELAVEHDHYVEEREGTASARQQVAYGRQTLVAERAELGIALLPPVPVRRARHAVSAHGPAPRSPPLVGDIP